MGTSFNSDMQKRYWFALHPDVRRPIGGVKQIHRFVEHVNNLGARATIIQDDAEFHPGWFESKVPTISVDSLVQKNDLNPNLDIIILPETFINLLDTYFPSIPKIIFNQNGSYSFGLNREFDIADVLNSYHNPIIKHVLCVSDSDYSLLTGAFNLSPNRVTRIFNSIETDMFLIGNNKRKQIAYMPRKNPLDVKIVRTLLQNKDWLNGWTFKPLHGLSQIEVAEVMKESLVFMSFGHPEGFGLPLAEAVASGCALIGYSGIGGKEVFLNASKNGTSFEVSYGDWYGFVAQLKKVINLFDQDSQSMTNALTKSSVAISEIYSPVSMRNSIEIAMQNWS